jgi:competence protein ComEC
MPNPFLSVINTLLPEPQASLLNGILFGVKTSMPKEFYNSLVTTGTLHIIALSGMNITILTNLISIITLKGGRKKSSLLTIFFIIIFILFVGPSPSIVRAGIMGSLSLLAVYFGRQSWAILSLIIATGIMLLVYNKLILDLSFQLSFLSTLGIIIGGRIKINNKADNLFNKFKYIFLQNLKITLSAQVFTLPVIVYNFHRISLIAPLANILIEWVTQPIMILGFVTSVVGIIWLPLGYLPAWFSWVFLTYFIKIIELLSKIPGASISL